jgi:ATP-dependent DNA helicase RecQ
MDSNEELRVIAVGDDDQNIYEFRGANSIYLERFITEQSAAKYELVTNYRSKRNLVEFSNAFVSSMEHRLKVTPIQPFDKGNGILKLIRHRQGNMIDAIVQDVRSAELRGSTCVLTKTNEEALQTCGWLTKYGIPAKLIQSNKGFNLLDMVEVRYLFEKLGLEEGVFVITDDKWDNAKRELKERFVRSSKYEIVERLIKDFEQVNTGKKYRSDFEVFIRESLLEDFISTHGEMVVVSTIHKAKGKEFDNVFLMLNGLNADSDEIKRQIYVALTRAKSMMSIHVNNAVLDHIKLDNCEILNDDVNYPSPNQLVVQLSHRDVWLDYFEPKQFLVSQLLCGAILGVEHDCCVNSMGQPVMKFSRQFNTFVEEQNKKGFFIERLKVDFILYWTSEKSQKEFKIILPEVTFIKH